MTKQSMSWLRKKHNITQKQKPKLKTLKFETTRVLNWTSIFPASSEEYGEKLRMRSFYCIQQPLTSVFVIWKNIYIYKTALNQLYSYQKNQEKFMQSSMLKDFITQTDETPIFPFSF